MSIQTIDSSNTDLFHKYLDKCKGKVQSESTDGYYHVDVVAEAYTQGFSDGTKSGKQDFMKQIISKELEKFTQRANQIYILSKNLISYLGKKELKVEGLFINLSPLRPSIIISVESNLLNDDDFIDLAYSKMFENKNIFNKLFNENLDIGFVASDNLNEDLLEEDGFGYVEKYN